MDPNTVFDTKVYLIRIKDTVDKWDLPDIVYALGYEGGAGVSYNLFRSMTEKGNNKWLISMKANKKDEEGKDLSWCTWSDCLDTFDEMPATGKQKISITTSVATFLEIATLAYKGGLRVSAMFHSFNLGNIGFYDVI